MARLRVIRSRLTGTLAMGLPLESGWSSPHRIRMGYRRPQASRPGESLSVNRPFRGPLSCVPVPTDCDPRPRFRLGTPGPKGFRPSRGKPSNRPPRYHTHTKTTKHETQQLSASGKESGTYESSFLRDSRCLLSSANPTRPGLGLETGSTVPAATIFCPCAASGMHMLNRQGCAPL